MPEDACLGHQERLSEPRPRARAASCPEPPRRTRASAGASRWAQISHPSSRKLFASRPTKDEAGRGRFVFEIVLFGKREPARFPSWKSRDGSRGVPSADAHQARSAHSSTSAPLATPSRPPPARRTPRRRCAPPAVDSVPGVTLPRSGAASPCAIRCAPLDRPGGERLPSPLWLPLQRPGLRSDSRKTRGRRQALHVHLYAVIGGEKSLRAAGGSRSASASTTPCSAQSFPRLSAWSSLRCR